MKSLIRISLVIVLVGAVALAVFVLVWHRDKEAWSAMAGDLAVIAAIIAVLPALKVLELQEDALRPRPTPYFDLTSRCGLLLLRVENFGASTALDIRLKWHSHPKDHSGENISALDNISVLHPGKSVSVLAGQSSERVREYASAKFTGQIYFRDGAGRERKDDFVCSVDASQKQLVHDDEFPRTLRDLQDIPKELSRIAESLKRS